MQGKIRHYGTNHDLVEGLRIQPDDTKAWLQDQYDNREIWFTVKKLYMAGDTYLDEENVEQTYAEDEVWEVSDTSRVSEITDEEGNVTQRYGQVFQVDPNAYVTSRLGVTWEEVATILAR